MIHTQSGRKKKVDFSSQNGREGGEGEIITNNLQDDSPRSKLDPFLPQGRLAGVSDQVFYTGFPSAKYNNR